MLYNTKNTNEAKDLIERVKFLIRNKKLVEMKAKRPKVTHKLRGYTHVLIGLIAIDQGDRIEIAKKDFYKIRYNKDLFIRSYHNKKGYERK